MAGSAVRAFPVQAVARWRAVSPGVKDAAVAVALALFTQVELLLADRVAGPVPVQVASFAVMTLAVAWRRTAPLVASALAGAGLIGQTLAGEAPVVGGFVAVLIVMYSVASYAGLRHAVLGGAAVLAGVFTYPLVNDVSFGDEAGNLTIFAGAWILGRAIRSRQLRAVEAESRVMAVERDREERLRAVVAEERGRIARELHDIVAHGVSVMVLQAGAARQQLDRDTGSGGGPAGQGGGKGRVRESLLTVEQMGRQSLDEMHRLLGVLRHDDDGPALAPPLTLDALPRLLDDVRRTGLAVQLRVEGEPVPLPAGLEVSGYRIVQKALTNTIKHADAASVDVTVRYAVDEIELRIADDGRATERVATPGGHGLVGMRERAELFGGSITAGPVEPHGWQVRARLPVAGTP